MTMAFLDPERKRELGYKDPKSKVYQDGRERLVGRDWKLRVKELNERSGGQCERRIGGPLFLKGRTVRCLNPADHPHHVTLRSVERDDRLAALLHICEWCHQVMDFEQREAIRARNRAEHEELRQA